MTENVIENMRKRIALCRRLAGSTTDRAVAATLRQMAEEGEADIKRLQAEARDEGETAE